MPSTRTMQLHEARAGLRFLEEYLAGRTLYASDGHKVVEPEETEGPFAALERYLKMPSVVDFPASRRE